nr:PREDICTED: LOW QUALITY PROTEIN: uncharacterized protein LOC108951924 [Musa acuminata subsp. malaccensis]
MDTGRELAKRVVHNGINQDTTTSFTAGANTVVSDQDQEPIHIWILTCRSGWLVVSGSRRNASFMPRVLATACIHSVILPRLHSFTSLLNILTLPCCVLGTSSIRSGLLAPVHSSATDDTRGIFLWRFFLFITGISMILFYQMKQQASVHITHKKEMVVARSTLVHLLHSAPAPLWYGIISPANHSIKEKHLVLKRHQ